MRNPEILYVLRNRPSLRREWRTVGAYRTLDEALRWKRNCWEGKSQIHIVRQPCSILRSATF